MSALRTAYGAYLSAGADRSAASRLSTAAADVGRRDLADLLTAYHERGPGWHLATTGAAAGHQVFVASHPPEDQVGLFWFDTCDLSLMICLAKYVDPETFEQLTAEARARLQPTIGWLSMEPVLGWQFAAFCDVAPIHRTAPTSRRPFIPLDPARIDLDSDLPVTSLSVLEASLYLTWFGKLFPHEFKWQQAHRQLGTAPWASPAREWAGAAAFDDAVYVVLTPENIDKDLAELADTSEGSNVFYEVWDTPDDVTFRAQIERTYGLNTSEVTPDANVFGLKLDRRFIRPSD